ncbi:tripartite tricarboxylate transporter TctB family protein [Amorphus sp. MBR-141]
MGVLRNKIDVLAGLLVIAFGVIAVSEALQFNLGSARRMGPGYFPFYIGCFLILVGVGLLVEQFWKKTPDADAASPMPLRTILLIMAAVCSFAVTIERFGLAPATAISVFLGSLADRNTSMLQKLALTLIVPFACVLIFWLGLSIQVDVFRWRP